MMVEHVTWSASKTTASKRYRRQHVITLLAAGFSSSDIIQQTGYPARTVRYIAQQYRNIGLAARIDGRHRTHAMRQLLSDEDEHDLRLALREPPPHGKRWSGPLVAGWIAARTGQRVSRQRGWEYLCRLAP